jgi:hypothetical protein
VFFTWNNWYILDVLSHFMLKVMHKEIPFVQLKVYNMISQVQQKFLLLLLLLLLY